MTWGRPASNRPAPETFETLSPAAASATNAPPPHVDDRYRVVARLGQGGMGEVWRVEDRRLARTVAMKVIATTLVDPEGVQRFREEAQVAASLQHPGIVPVHDLGQLPDGRVWFTMAEVRGQTLEALLQEVHRDWRLDVRNPGTSPRRLLEMFLRVCETVAFAHDHHVVHRDLKPSNIMVGDYGEVLVLDWGLARVFGDLQEGGPTKIVGTPAYMSPEQARGQSDDAGPRSDVHALGATLYDLLCERPPRLDRSVAALLARVAEGTPIRPPSAHDGLPGIDDALDTLCLTALAHDPADRHPHAGALAADLAAWLDGARKRDAAMALVRCAEAALRAATRTHDAAVVSSAEAARILMKIPHNAPTEDKIEVWARQDAARESARRAVHQRTEAIGQLRSALTHAPDLAEAHALLAAAFHRRHSEHEAAGRNDEAAEAAAALVTHDRNGHYSAYLQGTGALTLVTDPEGAEVRLHRLEERGRRLQPVFERVLGTTPLVAEGLAMGNYLLTLHRDGHHPVPYPVQITRQHHWDGHPPGGSAPAPIPLPPLDALEHDDLYVPRGWCWVGDPALPDALPWERVWVEGLVVKRFPVTLAEYQVYLNDLVRAGDESRVEAAQPRLSDSDEPFLHRDATGRFAGITHEGRWREVLPPTDRLPIVQVDQDQCRGYAAWRSTREGRPWRLPREREWQKAGRGVDGRPYPWGSHFEPTWCRMRDSGDRISIVSVDDYPEDCSIYGVRGMLGNVFEWAGSGRGGSGDPLFLGASCGNTPLMCLLSRALPAVAATHRATLGMRLVRSSRKFETID